MRRNTESDCNTSPYCLPRQLEVHDCTIQQDTVSANHEYTGKRRGFSQLSKVLTRYLGSIFSAKNVVNSAFSLHHFHGVVAMYMGNSHVCCYVYTQSKEIANQLRSFSHALQYGKDDIKYISISSCRNALLQNITILKIICYLWQSHPRSAGSPPRLWPEFHSAQLHQH